MSDNWTATVMRMDPASDVLIVKCRDRLSQQTADEIRRRIQAILPDLKVLIFDQGIEAVVIKKRRAKTLVRAARNRR